MLAAEMRNEENLEKVVIGFDGILHPVHVRDMVRSWLREDTSSFDFSGFAVSRGTKKMGDANGLTRAVIRCKSAKGILAGIPFANAVFNELDCQFTWHITEGSNLGSNLDVVTVTGEARNVLLAERVVLNCMARASGIATLANKLRAKLDCLGWPGELAGTRKTTPGFRMVEKYALLVGGASMHRYDLSSMIMLKDNHIKINGSIKNAIALARKVGGFTQKIEVECETLKEAEEAAAGGADIIMLDNFLSQDLVASAQKIKQNYPHILVEASGGISEENIVEYATPHVDIISTSLLVQGYHVLDFSMKIP